MNIEEKNSPEGILKEMKPISPEMRQKNYEENFALLRTRYPEIARWLQSSNNGKVIAVKLKSEDFAFLLQENGKRHWLTGPENPKDKAKRALEQNIDLVRRGAPLGVEPLLLIGMGAGYELIEFFNAQPKMFLWMKQAIYVVERSRDIFRLNLEIHDWKKILSSDRVFFFVGKKFDQQLKKFFQNPSKRLPRPIFTYQFPQGQKQSPITRVAKTIEGIKESRRKEAERLFRETNRYYESLSDKDWQRIFSSRRERPLRILLVTCRFTTFIQYCIRDVAQGFESLGHQTRTLIEKADTERMSTWGILYGLASFKPDMIFIIDHLRAQQHGPLYHKSIPFVCWVQDEMPNLYNPQAAKTIGKRDIVLFAFTSFKQQLLNLGYPDENLSYLPVSTNPKLYRPMSLSDKEREKYGCEVSYVSHTSQSPENAFIDLLFGVSDLETKEVLKIMCELVKERFLNEKDCHSQKDYELLLLDAERRSGKEIRNSKARSEIVWSFWHDVGNAFRKQLPLEWVAEDGYDLKLYGRGWENHPRLSKYAQGIARNGKELCKIYNASQINIQVLAGGNLHPRLVDGIASGGCFLAKYSPVDYQEGQLASYFDMGKDIIEFRGKDDLLRKVRFYLDHPEERRSIVERARKKVLEKLTYPVSMQSVIDVVRKQIERN